MKVIHQKREDADPDSFYGQIDMADYAAIRQVMAQFFCSNLSLGVTSHSLRKSVHMNKTFKIIGLVVVSIIALVAVIVTIVFSMTSGMVKTADDFFGAVKKQDFSNARTYLAEEFRANTDEQTLKAYLSKSAVLNFKEASWSSRSINNGRGELEGSVSTENGGSIPIKLTFVKEGELWKIYAMQKPSAGIQSESSDTSIPNKDEQIALVKKSWHDFAVSVKAKSMEHFYSTISSAWKSQFTV